MKWILVAVAVVAGLPLLVTIVGALRPKTHTATYAAVLAVGPERIWEVLADVERQPEWVPGITKVERLPDRGGKASYRETFGRFDATTVVTTSAPPRLLVKDILPGGGFYGSWTWELTPAGERTRLTITEHGTVENPFFRGMLAFSDNTKSARQYAMALAERLGVAIEPAH